MPLTADASDLTLHDWGGPDGAPVLVLMHGMTDSGECWPDAVARWTPTYRVLAWDARGHGTSPRLTPAQLGGWASELMVDDAIQLLESLQEKGIRRPILVGHSMGGGTAGRVAARRPDLVTAVVLEDPALGVDDDETDEVRAQNGARSAQEAADWLRDPAAMEREGRAVNDGWPQSEYAPWARSKQQVDGAMLATGRMRPRKTWLDAARELAVPSLLVSSDLGFLWSAARRATLTSLQNPHLNVTMVPGSGHCVRRTRPDEFHRLVDPWLAEQFAAPSR